MQNNIKNIFFDLGGVILDIDFCVTQREFEKLGMKNIDNIFGQYKQVSFFDKFDRGEIDDMEFISEVKKLLPAKTSSDAIVKAWNAMLFDLPKEKFELLKQLKKNYRIFLMSNTNIIHYREYQSIIKKTYGINGLDDLFDKAYYSFFEGKRKPENDFFELILQENNLKKEETLFIDDTKTNTDAAEKIGLNAFCLLQNSNLTVLFENGILKEQKI